MAAGRVHERRAAIAVAALVSGFAVLHAVVAGLSWRSLRPDWGLDLAYFTQQVWNASHLRGFAQTLHWHESQSLLGNTHFNPIVLLGAPLQWVVPGIDSLLALQCLLVALGGVGAYRLARGHGAGPSLGVGVCAAFLLQAPLWRVVQADVRPLVWSVPFLVLLAAALVEQRRREALVWALLACLCREELPVLVAALCLGHAAGRHPAFRRRRTIALSVSAASLGFLWLASTLRPASDTYIEPHMWLLEATGWGLDLPRAVGPEPVFVERFLPRMGWLLAWAFPVGFVALLAPRMLVGAVPLLGYLLTTSVGWADWQGEGPHYTAPAVALVGAAAAAGLGWLAREQPTAPAPFTGPATGAPGRPRLAWGLLLAVLAIEGAQAVRAGTTWVEEATAPARRDDPDVAAVRALVDRIPVDAPAMADFTTVHLLVPRRVLYCYERDAMRGFDPEAQEPLLPQRDVQPAWALVAERHADWLARSERNGLVERARAGEYVLLGPP